MAVLIKYNPVTTDITIAETSSRYSLDDETVSKQKNKINVWTLHFNISFISAWSCIIGLIVKLIMYCMTVTIPNTNIIVKIIPKHNKLNSNHHLVSHTPHIVPDMLSISVESIPSKTVNKYMNPEQEENINPPMK